MPANDIGAAACRRCLSAPLLHHLILTDTSRPPHTDVYAMGVLLWEAYSGDRVFKQLSDSEVILAVVTRKARPQFPPDTPHRCAGVAAGRAPGAGALVEAFAGIGRP